MPEESIAAYINNIIASSLFIVIITIIFAFLFLLSRILVRRTGIRNDAESEKEAFISESSGLFNYKRDPYKRNNVFILATIFISMVIFIFFIFAVFNYSRDPAAGLNMYLITGILAYLIFMIVWLVKSKIIN
ncbi:MAG: hypothetical protein PHQ09_06040 [Actinomycetota bacterium]|nr:hypothetical protein [Actinomycetota bacterium]